MTEKGERPPGTMFVAAASIIFRFAVAVGVLAVLGDLLDRALHTPPWFMVGGMVLGVGLVILELEWRASRYRRRTKKTNKNSRGRGKAGGPDGGG